MAGEPEISRRTLLKGSAALGAGLAFGPALGATTKAWSRAPAAQVRRPRPNIVVITADDMRSDEARYMPNLQRLIGEQGTNFTAARHNIAMCSPARAGFLTGQYSKHHGVRSQARLVQWSQRRQQDTRRVDARCRIPHRGHRKVLHHRRGKDHASRLGRSPTAHRQEPGAVRLSSVGRGDRRGRRSSIRPATSSGGHRVPRRCPRAVLPVVHAHRGPQPVPGTAHTPARLLEPAMARPS